MSIATKQRKRSALRPTTVKTDHAKTPLDAGKVVITPLPRRNDDVYMRTVRRPRA